MIQRNIFLQTFSKGLETEVKDVLICSIYKRIQKENKLMVKKENSLVCICSDRLIVLSEDFNDIKISAFYENIERVAWNNENTSDIMVLLKEVNPEEKFYLLDRSFYLSFSYLRANFIKALITYYGIFFIQTKGRIIDLPTNNYETLLIDNVVKKAIDVKFFPNRVDGCIRESYMGYSFYLKGNPNKISDNEFEFIVDKNGENVKNNLKILVIDKLIRFMNLNLSMS